VAGSKTTLDAALFAEAGLADVAFPTDDETAADETLRAESLRAETLPEGTAIPAAVGTAESARKGVDERGRCTVDVAVLSRDETEEDVAEDELLSWLVPWHPNTNKHAHVDAIRIVR
jgi:transcriptional regulator GlxA family with amidase domain